jgi:hypothetical protein
VPCNIIGPAGGNDHVRDGPVLPHVRIRVVNPDRVRQRVPGFGRFRLSAFEYQVSGFGFRISGLGCRVAGCGFRVSYPAPWEVTDTADTTPDVTPKEASNPKPPLFVDRTIVPAT